MNQIARLRASFKYHKRSRSMDNSIKEPLYLNVDQTDDHRQVSDSDICKSSMPAENSGSETPKKRGSFQKLKQELKKFRNEIDLVKKLFKKHKSHRQKKPKWPAKERSYSEAQLVEESTILNDFDGELTMDNFAIKRKVSRSESSLDHIRFDADAISTSLDDKPPQKPSFSTQLRMSFRKIVVRNKSINKYQGFRNDNSDSHVVNPMR